MIFKFASFILIVFSLTKALGKSDSQESITSNGFGEPVGVLSQNSNGTFTIDHDFIESILLHQDVRERKVVVVSIAGAFRKGKSFFMSYCLRFMYANYKSVNNPGADLSRSSSWMGSENEPLNGFTWKSGSAKDTTGIVIWSDVFLHTTPTGEELAIILMDSQGLYASKSSPKDDSKILGISILLSSIQILNMNGVIQEDQLQYLQMVTEFSKYAANSTASTQYDKPKLFQNLIFLVRDWMHSDYNLGKEGGLKYIQDVLDVGQTGNNNAKSVRSYILEAFENVTCFLLPSPGRVVERGFLRNKQVYDGRWSEMDEEFQEELKAAIQDLLQPGNLKVKKMNGKDLNSAEFNVYLKEYLDAFLSNKAPASDSVYEMTVKQNLKLLVQELLEDYEMKIINAVSESEDKLGTVNATHLALTSTTVNAYQRIKKMGSDRHHQLYLNQLRVALGNSFAKIYENVYNNERQIFSEKEFTRLANVSREDRYDENKVELQRIQNDLVKLKERESTMQTDLFKQKLGHLNQEEALISESIRKYEESQQKKISMKNFLYTKYGLQNESEHERDLNDFRQSYEPPVTSRSKNAPRPHSASENFVHTAARTIRTSTGKTRSPSRHQPNTQISSFEATKHRHGEPLNILFNDGTLRTNDEAISNVFMHPLVKKRKVVVMSIAGAFRKGKSFFMDYCLRFMYANYKSINYKNNSLSDRDDWMGHSDEPLIGFTWKSGSARDTSGIIVWSDVFLHTDDDTGEELAIILMDSQGLFDIKTSSAENSKIFALSTLISSIQIFNINGNIQEDQLQYLQLMTDFAKYASSKDSNDDDKEFQKLIFLIRDWNHNDYTLGLLGGSQYIEDVLSKKPKQGVELQSSRDYIYDSFESILCYLMPGPGRSVESGVMRNGEAYDGRWSEMDSDFIEELKAVIPFLLSPEKLEVKRIHGKELTSRELKQYMEGYLTAFLSNNVPHAESLFETTVQESFRALNQQIYDEYRDDMIEIIKPAQGSLQSQFDDADLFCKIAALASFDNAKKLGTPEQHRKFRNNLEERLKNAKDELYKFAARNQQKFAEQAEKIERDQKERDEKHQQVLRRQKALEEEFAQSEASRTQEEISELKRNQIRFATKNAEYTRNIQIDQAMHASISEYREAPAERKANVITKFTRVVDEFFAKAASAISGFVSLFKFLG